MRFKVELSELAGAQYDKFLEHLYFVLKNPQAADSLMEDFDDMVAVLEEQADSFGYCRSRRLRKMGFHKIRFKRHRYLFVYRIKGDSGRHVP